jgi:outer membrane protein assembly factor BamA
VQIRGLVLLIFSSISFLLLGSCTAKKFIPEGKHLVRSNEIVIEGDKPNFNRSDLSTFITQRRHRSFFGMRGQLWLWYVTENKTDVNFWRWVHESFGRPPVYYDEFAAESTVTQMLRYTSNVGHFNAEINHSVKQENKMAHIKYEVKPGWAYTYNSVNNEIADTIVAGFFEQIKQDALVKEGAFYNAYRMDEERERITEHLKNSGYYYFARDYILFEIDSSRRDRSMDLTMRINNMRVPTSADRSSFISKPHQRYFINQVNVFPAHSPFNPSTLPFDTVKVTSSQGREKHDLYFYFQGDPRLRPSAFTQSIQIQDGEPYSLRKVRQTYRGLANYRLFFATNITFDTLIQEHRFDDSERNWIDATIQLQRSKTHSYSVEVEGTNSGGDLGIRGSLVYMNKNIFRGAEIFRFRINGGIEAQRIISVLQVEEPGAGRSIFNTTEFGADASLFFPRFLSPIPLRHFIREYQPKTNLSLGYSSQQRQHYSRIILRTSFGYDWMASPTITHILTPINLSSVRVDPSSAFAQILSLEENQRIRDQYSNHLIASIRYSFIFNNQNINKLNDFFYVRANIESSGNMLSALNNTPLITQNENHNELLGIRYAQFMRFDIDFRYYRLLNPTNRLVFRTLLGVGLPYGNSRDMPFERSFYAGGANGMRGWQFRELGPGTFSGKANIERIGDIQLEANAEYRFPIYNFLKGALFVDVGNIWTINELDYLPGGVFDIDRFYKQLAVDAGFGFRFDFSFFIFRIDTAIPLRIPSNPPGGRWVVDKLRISDSMWQFGIGYPF